LTQALAIQKRETLARLSGDLVTVPGRRHLRHQISSDDSLGLVIGERPNAPHSTGALRSSAPFSDGGEFFERTSGDGDSADVELHG
jgi:hypothetical protein